MPLVDHVLGVDRRKTHTSFSSTRRSKRLPQQRYQFYTLSDQAQRHLHPQSHPRRLPLPQWRLHHSADHPPDESSTILRSSPQVQAYSRGSLHFFYRTTYLPAMTYNLPAVLCDEAELQQVQSSVLPALLNQLGVHSKYPTALRHAPTTYAGINIADLRTKSGVYLLKALQDSVFANNEHGKMMLTSIKTSQLESGLSIPLLLKPTIPVSYLTPTWITTIRQFLSRHGMTADLTDQLDMTPSCLSDQLIMNPVTIQQYSPDKQLDINLVCIHLQAVYISDLATGDGLSLQRNSLNGQQDSTRHSSFIWPQQPTITTKQQNRWRS
jgi:hypothetical protein